MAILGTYIDKQTITRAGTSGTTAAGAHVVLTTLAHSLPATNPEAVFVAIRSIDGGVDSGVVTPFVLGGNASLLTLGYRAAVSSASLPAIMSDIFAMTFHSIIR